MKKLLKMIMLLLIPISLVSCGKGKLSENEISNLVIGSGLEIGDKMLAVIVPIDKILSFEVLERNTDKKNGYDEMRVSLKAQSGAVTIDATTRITLTYDIETWKLSKAIASDKNVALSIDQDLTEYVNSLYADNKTLEEINILEQTYNVDDKRSANVKVELIGKLNNLDGSYNHKVNVLLTPQKSVSFYGGGVSAEIDINEESPIEILLNKDTLKIQDDILNDFKKQLKITLPNEYFSYYAIGSDPIYGNSLRFNNTGSISFEGDAGYSSNPYDEISIDAIISVDFTIIANKDSNITKDFKGNLIYKYDSNKNTWTYSTLRDL